MPSGNRRANYETAVVYSQKPVGLASFENHVMGDVPDDGVYKGRYHSRIFIVRSFEASGHASRSAWPRIAICLKSAAPAPPS